MGTRATTIELTDFSGGRNSNSPELNVPSNQALDLQNVIVLKNGFKKRFGNTAFNSVEMGGSSTPVMGIGYVKFNSGTEFLNAVAGERFYTSSSLSGTMTDATGSVSITSGQDNIWTGVVYNNLQIWFGGAPNAPFKYSGTGNAAALGGTPPSARTAFTAANRIFALSTSSDPSIFQWSVLANPEDWTGTGSGTQQVQKNDGEALLFGVPISSDVAILFKNSSTHYVPLTKSPFPVFTLQTKIGAAGRYSWVFVDGTIYFITPGRRMKATSDGRNFVDFPEDVNDLWDSTNTSRIENIYGIYYPDLRQIHWFCSIGTKNDITIIWDLQFKCWLYHSTGFKSNVACLVQNRRLFTGHYNGKIYEQDKNLVYSDASETNSAIDAFWLTPPLRLSTVSGIIYPYWIDVVSNSEAETDLSISYGFSFSPDQKNGSVNLVGSGGLWDVGLWDIALWGGNETIRKRIFTSGKGENFQIKVRNNTVSEGFTIQAISTRVGVDKAGRLVNAG